MPALRFHLMPVSTFRCGAPSAPKVGFAVLFFCLLFALSFGTVGVCRADQTTLTPVKTTRLRVGFLGNAFSAVNVKDAQVALKVWGDIVSRDMGAGFIVETFLIEDLAEVTKVFDSGEADVVVVSPVDLVRVRGRTKIPLDPMLVGYFSERTTEKYFLVVHRDNPAKNLEDLKGTLAIDNFSTGDLPQIWIDTELMRKKHLPSGRHFGSVKFFKNPSNVVLPVFFKQVQAGIVREYGLKTMIEMNPQVEKNVRVFLESDELPRGIFSIRQDYDPEIRERLMRICLKLHTHPKGEQMLTLFKVDGLRAYENGMLSGIENLLGEYDRLMGEQK